MKKSSEVLAGMTAEQAAYVRGLWSKIADLGVQLDQLNTHCAEQQRLKKAACDHRASDEMHYREHIGKLETELNEALAARHLAHVRMQALAQTVREFLKVNSQYQTAEQVNQLPGEYFRALVDVEDCLSIIARMG